MPTRTASCSALALVVLVVLAACGPGLPERQFPTDPTPTTLAPPPTTLAALSCRPSTAANPSCGRGPATFQAEVDAALELLVRQHPEIFDLNDVRGANSYAVRNVQAYLDLAVANVRAMGRCARWNGEELQVKDVHNTVDDAYDILTGDNRMRRGEGSYRGNCVPASF